MMLLSRFFILLLCLAVLSLNEEAEGISGPYPGLKRGKFLKVRREPDVLIQVLIEWCTLLKYHITQTSEYLNQLP